MDIPPIDFDAGPVPERPGSRRPSRIINYESALKRLGGRKELFGSLAGFFLSDAPDLLQQIQDGLRKKDAELVSRCAHSLKGLAANFDAEDAQSCAFEIEKLAAGNRLSQAARHVPELQNHIQQLQDELRPYVNSQS